MKELINTWKFDWVNPEIEKNLVMEKARSYNYKLFHFDKTLSSKEVIKEMEKEGYIPANSTELLSWKDWNNKDWVVALGSVARVGGGRGVLCLYGDGSERRLLLLWFGGGWNSGFRFLAVRTGSEEPKKLGVSHLDSLSLGHLERIESKLDRLLKHLGIK